MKSARPRLEVNLEELDRVLDQARQAPLSAADCKKLKDVLHALVAKLARFRTSEKTEAVVKDSQPKVDAGTPPESDSASASGHGRNGAEKFDAARKVGIAHPTLKHGDRCPECGRPVIADKTGDT